MTLGTLLSPTVSLIAGGVQLMPYTDDGLEPEFLAHSVSVGLTKDSSVPKLTFEVLANPRGFAWFQQFKAEKLSEPIVVRFGYPGGSSIQWVFKYSGMNLTTGRNPSLRLTCVGILKGCITDNRLSFSMENAVSLYEFPQFVQSQAGECAAGVKFEWVGTAAETAKQIMVKSNYNQVTPFNIIQGVLRRHGYTAQVGDSAMGDGVVVISASPAYEGETTVDVPVLNEGETPAKPAVRSMWVCGPSAIQSVARSQDFSTGTQPSNLDSSATQPISEETNAKKVVQPGSSPQGNAANQQQPSGTRGPSNPGPNATATEKGDGDAEKRRAALAKALQTTVSLEMLYLPVFASGIRPRDIITIPSLKAGADRYVEDFECTSVMYKLARNGGVTMSITGQRPFTGEANMIDDASLAKVRAVCDSMETLEDWAAYNWVGNNANAGRAPALAG